MSYITVLLLLFCCAAVPKGALGETSPKFTEKNGLSVFLEMLRGRDGLPDVPGRDGAQNPPGLFESQGPAALQKMEGSSGGGAIYTRWGKSSCPSVKGTDLLYSGIVGGTHYSHPGGGANYLCLPKNPQYSSSLTYRPGVSGFAYMYGTEYELPLQGSHDHNVPCAVCHVSTRAAVVMIPAKASCPHTWTREYYGYLMTAHFGHHRTMFECVDRAQESLRGSSHNQNGALFYHIEGTCGVGLPCPPYNRQQELNCVVCTK